MGDVLDLIFDGVAMMVDVMDNNFVFTLGGFTFSLWQFEIACFLLCIIVPAVLITRSQPVETSVSERSFSEHEWLESVTNGEIERGKLDVNRAADRWADYYERHGV